VDVGSAPVCEECQELNDYTAVAHACLVHNLPLACHTTNRSCPNSDNISTNYNCPITNSDNIFKMS